MLRKLFTAVGVAVGAVGFALLPLAPAAAQTGGLIDEITSGLNDSPVYNAPYSGFSDTSDVIQAVQGVNVKVVIISQSDLDGVPASSIANEVYTSLGEADATVIVVNPDTNGTKDSFAVSPSRNRDDILATLNTANQSNGGDLTVAVHAAAEKIDSLSFAENVNEGAGIGFIGGGIGVVLLVAALSVVTIRKLRKKPEPAATITAEAVRASGYNVQPVPAGFVGSAADRWRELQNRLAIVSTQDLEAEASYEVDRVKKDLSDLVKLVDSYNDLKEAPSEVELTEALVALDDELKGIIDGKKAVLNSQLASFRDWLKARKKDAGLRL